MRAAPVVWVARSATHTPARLPCLRRTIQTEFMKSRTAFEFTVRKMLRECGKLYFWTFTFRDVYSFKEALSRWNEFLTLLKRKFGFRGVRVLELHEEHGVHFHVLTNRRFQIREILALGAKYGFGRTHVEFVEDVEKAVGYLCKYLSKPRPPCLKRARLWAAFGEVPRTRVSDVVTDTPFGRILRRVMRTLSPAEELSGRSREEILTRKNLRRVSFLKAYPVAIEKYLLTFDPDFLIRQRVWGQRRLQGLCPIAPQWMGAFSTGEEE